MIHTVWLIPYESYSISHTLPRRIMHAVKHRIEKTVPLNVLLFLLAFVYKSRALLVLQVPWKLHHPLNRNKLKKVFGQDVFIRPRHSLSQSDPARSGRKSWTINPRILEYLMTTFLQHLWAVQWALVCTKLHFIFNKMCPTRFTLVRTPPEERPYNSHRMCLAWSFLTVLLNRFMAITSQAEIDSLRRHITRLGRLMQVHLHERTSHSYD